MPALGKSGTLRIFVLSESILIPVYPKTLCAPRPCVEIFLCALPGYTEPREPIRRLELRRLDIVDTRTCRPATQRHLETQHRFGIAFGDHFDASVVAVSHVSLNALTMRRLFDEKS